MFLYNLTLQRATGISYAIHGNFSGSWKIKKRGKKGKKKKKGCGARGGGALGVCVARGGGVTSSGVCGGMEGSLGV